MILPNTTLPMYMWNNVKTLREILAFKTFVLWVQSSLSHLWGSRDYRETGSFAMPAQQLKAELQEAAQEVLYVILMRSAKHTMSSYEMLRCWLVKLTS